MPLRLKSLELHGYKTFASRANFEFAEGITAIVGPNGSGKSNIADALRWVLGEQTYSLLRAKKTEDMIFAGSEHRARSGMAGATLIFDNSDAWLPVDFSEVGLGRRAYRDGRNEYIVNGQSVRLRDLNELLAQSGLAERTYTFLGQGLVDASLALKADERRRLFEEAAGVGLYRVRREEALRRLDTTKRNLERVLDIMAELEPRLRYLERQARRAEEHSRLQADLHVVLREWYGYHWHRAQRELTEARQALNTHDGKLKGARNAYQQLSTDVNQSRHKVQELRAQLSGWHRESSRLHAERESVSRDLAVMDERRRSLQLSNQDVARNKETLTQEMQHAWERKQESEQEISRLMGELYEARAQVEAARNSLEERRQERATIEGSLQTHRQKLNSLTAKQAEFQARSAELSNRITSQKNRLQGAEQNILLAEEKLQSVDQDRKNSGEALHRAEADLENAEKNLSAQQSRVVVVETNLKEKRTAYAGKQAEHSRLAAQLEVLEQAEKSLTGYAEGARHLLEAARTSQLTGSHGALSAALDVPAEYEIAVAAALGEHVDAVLLEAGTDAQAAIQLLEKDQPGRAALLPLEWLRPDKTLKAPADNDCFGVAAALVKCRDALRPAVDLLLGQVLIVRDRETARRLLNGQLGGVKAVTLRGQVFRADGSVLIGQQSKGSTLGRQRQRRETQEALDAANDQLSTLDVSIGKLTRELDSAASDLDKNRQSLQQANTRLNQVRMHAQQARLAFESAQRERDWQQDQAIQLRKEIAQAQGELEQISTSDSGMEAQITETQEIIRTVSGQLSEMTLIEVQSQVTHWETRFAVAERAVSDGKSRRSEREQQITRIESQQKTAQQRLLDIEKNLQALDADKENQLDQEADLNGKIAAIRQKIEPAEQALLEAERAEVSTQEREQIVQRDLTNTERVYTQLQLDVTRRQEALENLRHRIEDDFGLVHFSYEADMAGPVPLPFDGMVEQLPHITTLSPDLEEMLTQKRAQIRRMGAINPEAKQEYDSEQERYLFMKDQIEDLRHAESDLREVIAELDELTRREFSKTFDEVAKYFRDIFVRLFGGGSARLVLTDPDNLTDTGIDIEARLPGRREQGLALLSGGERSLTAIALVFALLKVSPTPLCVMDEVDAMLDEANVGRFRDLLVELSKETQFIVITHNRNTVQAADVIYGVTMGRDSASQIISLRLDELSDDMLGGS